MKAIAYIRVSSDEQVQGTSLDSQHDACLEYAVRNGLNLSREDIYREEGVSAKLLDRPVLDAMLRACANPENDITHCIVWKVDRLARKSEYYHLIKARLKSYGVKLVSVTESFSDDPAGNLMEGVLAQIAQFDNEVRGQRAKTGLRARAQQGGWTHFAPLGYKNVRNDAGVSTLEPDEVAPLVKEVIEEFATGSYTVREMTDYAFKRGLLTRGGRRIHWQPLRDLISNPIYAGIIVSKLTDGEPVEGLHKPLISRETHQHVKDILEGRTKPYSRHASADWPLRGGFLRHDCGKPLTGSAPRGRSGPSPRYHCPFCRSAQGSPTSKRRELVHDDFMQLLAGIRLDEPAQILFKEVVLKRWSEQFKIALEQDKAVAREIDEVKARKSRILDLFIDGKLTQDEREQKMAEANDEALRLELQKADIDDTLKDKESIIDGALLFMSDPGKFWNLGGPNLKKRVQDTLFPDGLVYNFASGFGTAKLAEPYLLASRIDLASDSDSLNDTYVVGLERIELSTKTL